MSLAGEHSPKCRWVGWSGKKSIVPTAVIAHQFSFRDEPKESWGHPSNQRTERQKTVSNLAPLGSPEEQTSHKLAELVPAF